MEKVATLIPKVDVNVGDHQRTALIKKCAGDYDEDGSVEEIGGNLLLLNLIGPDHRGVEESDHHIHVNAPPSSRSLFH